MDDLRDTGYDMFSFIEMTPDLICIAGKDGYLRKVNQAVVAKLEYSLEELLQTPIVNFIYPDDRDKTISEREKLLHGQVLVNFENRYVSKTGKIIWLEWTSIYFIDKEVVFAIAKDVTERKLLEIAVEEKYRKYKNLATHFKASIEQDRKYFAVEMHEELAQLASVVKMNIDWISIHETSLSVASKKRIEHAAAVSNMLIQAMRRLSFSISPGMLDELGLNASMEWYCKEFAVLTGISCHFESAYNEQLLSKELQIDFFRICQEAMSNIMLYAEASNVLVRIEEKPEGIELLITDDGIGFDLPEEVVNSGIKRMKERAVSVNATLHIDTKPGKGTRVSALFPK